MPVFLERYVLPFLVLVGGALLLYNPMHWTGMQRGIAGVGDLVLALSAALWVQSQAKKGSKNTKRVVIPGRTMIPAGITPKDMASAFNDERYNTNQARRLTEDYLGKWMRYSGKVDNVSGSAIFFSYPSGKLLGMIVYADFEQPWVSQISMLPPGREVTIVGKVGRIDRSTIFLQECELVEDEA